MPIHTPISSVRESHLFHILISPWDCRFHFCHSHAYLHHLWTQATQTGTVWQVRGLVKQTLRWKSVQGVNRGVSDAQHQSAAEKKASRSRGVPVVPSQQGPRLSPPGALKLGWPFRVAPNWSKRARVLYPGMDRLWVWGGIGVGACPVARQFFSDEGQRVSLGEDHTLSCWGGESFSPKQDMCGVSQHPPNTDGLCSSPISLHGPCLGHTTIRAASRHSCLWDSLGDTHSDESLASHNCTAGLWTHAHWHLWGLGDFRRQ